jgi:nucleoside-diphosphate-sugar epimerase
MGNHALVFGATGIQGWAVVNQILKGYPSADAFDKVTALTNRPITEEMLWPESKKLQVVSGINLLTDKGQEALEKEMKEKIPDVDTVTHMFFFGMISLRAFCLRSSELTCL